MNRETLISVTDLCRYYGDHCAVDNISFSIERGEVLGFLGPNGAGKSTTMQILSGVLTPGAGKVTIAGIDILDEPRAARQHIGFLPEQPPLYPDLTVDEYLHYAARLRGVARTAVSKAMDHCKQRCGLGDTGKRLIKNLSKGYQQRVGIAQALIHTPAVIILDEPTSGLDPIQIREIRQLIRELGSDHSVILSTHILPEVQTICNRVLIIHQGKLVFDQRLDTLNADNRETLIRLGFRQPPAPETLAAIPGIDRVEPIDGQHFLIGMKTGTDVLDAIVRQSIASGWGLCEMIPQSASLEEIFMRLTCGEGDNQPEPVPVAQ